MDLVFFRGDFSIQRPLRAEIEVDALIYLLHLRVVVDLIFDAVPRGVKRPQAALGVALRPAARVAHKVGDEVDILVHGHTGQFHAGRLRSGASDGGVERVVDERCDVLRILADATAWIVLRHRLLDVLRELAERLIASQRTRKALNRALSGGTVAGRALLPIDFLAAPGFAGLFRCIRPDRRNHGQADGSRQRKRCLRD